MAAKHEPEKRLIDLNEIVEEALLFIRHDIDSKSIVLSTTFAAALPQVIGDRIQLQQVIINLLVNSVQAIMQSGQPTRRIDIQTSIDEKVRSCFSVFDKGPALLPRTSSISSTASSAPRMPELASASPFASRSSAAHGGRISGANRPNGGAHFRFTLPVPAAAASNSNLSIWGHFVSEFRLQER